MSELNKELEASWNSDLYTDLEILRLEKIYGRGFVSNGGLESTKEYVRMLELKPDQKVLDVGCGIGGSACYMCKNFGVNVLAVDLSSNMIKIAKQRVMESHCADKVKFAVVDITAAEYEPASFDVIYSRDAIMHIEEKEKVFGKFLKWLKPGGKLFTTDNCQGEQKLSDGFKAWLEWRHYYLLTVKDYGKLLEKVGFVDVKAEDKTELLKSNMKRELKNLENIKDEFLKEFSQSDYDYLVDGWNLKLERCAIGDHTWGAFYAVKPFSVQG